MKDNLVEVWVDRSSFDSNGLNQIRTATSLHTSTKLIELKVVSLQLGLREVLLSPVALVRCIQLRTQTRLSHDRWNRWTHLHSDDKLLHQNNFSRSSSKLHVCSFVQQQCENVYNLIQHYYHEMLSFFHYWGVEMLMHSLYHANSVQLSKQCIVIYHKLTKAPNFHSGELNSNCGAYPVSDTSQFMFL